MVLLVLRLFFFFFSFATGVSHDWNEKIYVKFSTPLNLPREKVLTKNILKFSIIIIDTIYYQDFKLRVRGIQLNLAIYIVSGDNSA